MQALQIFVDADLAAVRKLINDCVRDGVVRVDLEQAQKFPELHQYKPFTITEFPEMRECKQFETPDRVIWIAGDIAIESARIGDRTKLTLLRVRGYLDEKGARAWGIISRQLYYAGVIRSLDHLQGIAQKAFAEDFLVRDTFIKSPRPQLPDEQQFKAEKRAELQRNRGEHKIEGRQITGADIEMIVTDVWNAKQAGYPRLLAQWEEIHRLAAMTMEQAIEDYLGEPAPREAIEPSALPSQETQPAAPVKPSKGAPHTRKLKLVSGTGHDVPSRQLPAPVGGKRSRAPLRFGGTVGIDGSRERL